MHVLVVPSFYPTDLNPIGGQFFQDQVLGLRKHGVEVGVAYANCRSLRRGYVLPGLLTHRFQPVASEENGIPTLRLMSWNMLGQFTVGGLTNGAMIGRAASHYIKRFGRPDLIHAHQARWGGHGAMLAAKAHGIPYVITEHESYFAEGKIPLQDIPHLWRIYQGASRVVAVSHAMAKAMCEVQNPHRVTVIPNMVNTDYFVPGTLPRATEPFTFLCVARLAQIKCIDLMIRAFADAFPGDPRFTLRLVGDGPERHALTALTRELGVADRVHFLGEMRHDGVLREMQQSNVFVLCSEVETFGVVLIEAIATGMPVIATRCGGPEDIVTDDVGLLVPLHRVDALADAMRRIHGEYARFQPNALHDFAVTRFSESTVCGQLIDLYHAVCEGVHA